MSIQLGIYDLFGNMIPGLLYLYLINEVLKEFHLNYIDFNKVENLAEIAIIGIATYVLGHAMSKVSYLFWYCRFLKKPDDKAALDRINAEYQHHKSPFFEFQPEDTKVLLSIIQHHNFGLSQSLERHRAIGIMARSLSFGLFLSFVIRIVFFILSPSNNYHMMLGILSAFLSVLLFFRAKESMRWFHRDIFVEGLNYGATLEEALTNSRKLAMKDVGPKIITPCSRIDAFKPRYTSLEQPHTALKRMKY